MHGVGTMKRYDRSSVSGSRHHLLHYLILLLSLSTIQFNVHGREQPCSELTAFASLLPLLSEDLLDFHSTAICYSSLLTNILASWDSHNTYVSHFNTSNQNKHRDRCYVLTAMQNSFLQCSDTVGWAPGGASRQQKTWCSNTKKISFRTQPNLDQL